MKQTQNYDPWRDTVKVKLFRDSGRYRDDLFVAVNGRRYRITRGSEVSVPRCVAEVIAASEAQDEATAGLISRVAGQYTEA